MLNNVQQRIANNNLEVMNASQTNLDKTINKLSENKNKLYREMLDYQQSGLRCIWTHNLTYKTMKMVKKYSL